MKLEDLKDHMDGRFDKVELKIDDHLQRISKAETDIGWLKGFTKIAITAMVSLLGAALGILAKLGLFDR